MSIFLKKEVGTYVFGHIPLFSYRFFEEIIDFVKSYWQKRKFFFPGYFFIYPKLNENLKLRYDYVLTVKNKSSTKEWRIY